MALKTDSVEFDRNKYLEIASRQSISDAITELHHDLNLIEIECFEGRSGYRPELYEEMKKFRDFSRELWQLQRKKEEDEAKAAGLY